MKNGKTKQQLKIIGILLTFVLLLPNIFGLGVTAVGEAAGISDSIVITEPMSSLEKTIKTGTQFVIMCSFKNIASFDGRVFKITYIPSHVELIDFAAQTSKIDINVGTVPDTDLEIISHNTSTGELTFKINKAIPANKLWSGTVAILLFNAKITGSTIFYAQWTGANVAVNFFMNDGTAAEYPTGNIDNANKKDTDKITKPVNPYREGYVFGGWYLDDKCTVEWNLDNTLSLVNGVQESSGEYYLNLYAKWTIADVAVNFFMNYDSNTPYVAGNTINTNRKYTDTTTKPANPYREGYVFGGWYLDAKCTVEWNFANTLRLANGVRENNSVYSLNLYAKWTIADVSVSFFMNYDNNAPYTTGNTINATKKYTDTATKPTNPYREGYVFGGWYLDDKCTAEWNFANILKLANGVLENGDKYYLNLYAKWTIADVTVNFLMNYDNNAPYETGNITNTNKKYTDKTIKPTNPYREGYVFGGWYLDDKCTAEWNFSNILKLANGVQENGDEYYLNLYAKWTIADVAVNFFTNYGNNAPYATGNTINATKKYTDKVTIPAKPYREGYVFGGWYLDDKCTAEWNFENTLKLANGVQENGDDYHMNLYAKWTIADVAVNFFMNYDDNAPYETGNIVNANKKYYDVTIKPETPRHPGYIFMGWYLDDKCTVEWNFDNKLTLVNGVQESGDDYYLNLYAKWSFFYPLMTPDPTTNNEPAEESEKAAESPEEYSTIEINGNIVTTQKGNVPLENKDGSYTLPGGGEIKTPTGVTIIVPAGTIISPDGKVSFPKGGTIKLTYGSHTFNINKDAVIVLDDKIPLGYSVIINNPFKDIKKSDWFYDDVMYVYSHGLMGSTSVDSMLFSPNIPLTRGMIVTVLYRLAGSPDVSGLTNPFTDVSGNTWYTAAVKWAVENKIVNGYGNGKFGPDDNIIRQDMAVILMRYMSFIKYDYVVTEEYRVFADEGKIDDYSKNAVQVLNKLGIINGKGNGIIDPKGMATRAEVAAMLHRFLVNLK